LDGIRSAILNSDEKLCQTHNRWRADSLNNAACYREAEIQIAYQDILQRHADAGGLSYWVITRWDSSIYHIIQEIKASGEAQCIRRAIPIPPGYNSCYLAAVGGAF
jgi:hypothetical protein